MELEISTQNSRHLKKVINSTKKYEDEALQTCKKLCQLSDNIEVNS